MLGEEVAGVAAPAPRVQRATEHDCAIGLQRADLAGRADVDLMAELAQAGGHGIGDLG